MSLDTLSVSDWKITEAERMDAYITGYRDAWYELTRDLKSSGFLHSSSLVEGMAKDRPILDKLFG